MLVQSRRDSRAALRLMRKLLRRQGFVPKLLVTDKLRSYAAAFRRLRLTCRHEQGLRKNKGREFASGSPTTRAQAAAVQVGSIRPALSQRARCGSQHLQLSTPPHLPIHTADLPRRSYRTVARCRRSGMTRRRVLALDACSIRLPLQSRPDSWVGAELRSIRTKFAESDRELAIQFGKNACPTCSAASSAPLNEPPPSLGVVRLPALLPCQGRQSVAQPTKTRGTRPERSTGRPQNCRRGDRSASRRMSLLGQPEKTCHRYCTAGLHSTAEMLADGRHGRSVPRTKRRPRWIGLALFSIEPAGEIAANLRKRHRGRVVLRGARGCCRRCRHERRSGPDWRRGSWHSHDPIRGRQSCHPPRPELCDPGQCGSRPNQRLLRSAARVAADEIVRSETPDDAAAAMKIDDGWHRHHRSKRPIEPQTDRPAGGRGRGVP